MVKKATQNKVVGPKKAFVDYSILQKPQIGGSILTENKKLLKAIKIFNDDNININDKTEQLQIILKNIDIVYQKYIRNIKIDKIFDSIASINSNICLRDILLIISDLSIEKNIFNLIYYQYYKLFNIIKNINNEYIKNEIILQFQEAILDNINICFSNTNYKYTIKLLIDYSDYFFDDFKKEIINKIISAKYPFKTSLKEIIAIIGKIKDKQSRNDFRKYLLKEISKYNVINFEDFKNRFYLIDSIEDNQYDYDYNLYKYEELFCLFKNNRKNSKDFKLFNFLLPIDKILSFKSSLDNKNFLIDCIFLALKQNLCYRIQYFCNQLSNKNNTQNKISAVILCTKNDYNIIKNFINVTPDLEQKKYAEKLLYIFEKNIKNNIIYYAKQIPENIRLSSEELKIIEYDFPLSYILLGSLQTTPELEKKLYKSVVNFETENPMSDNMLNVEKELIKVVQEIISNNSRISMDKIFKNVRKNNNNINFETVLNLISYSGTLGTKIKNIGKTNNKEKNYQRTN